MQAESGEHLRRLLREDHRYIFTLIQKFHTEKGGTYPMLSDRSDIIVITDEAHRSQYDTFALNMRNALPNAAFIGFTGTPLMVGEEKISRDHQEYPHRLRRGAPPRRLYKEAFPHIQASPLSATRLSILTKTSGDCAPTIWADPTMKVSTPETPRVRASWWDA